MNKYQQELQALRPNDEIQAMVFEECDKGYGYITTASHGYLVVPANDKCWLVAVTICKCSGYSYLTSRAIYLEEDGDAPTFLNAVKHNKNNKLEILKQHTAF